MALILHLRHGLHHRDYILHISQHGGVFIQVADSVPRQVEWIDVLNQLGNNARIHAVFFHKLWLQHAVKAPLLTGCVITSHEVRIRSTLVVVSVVTCSLSFKVESSRVISRAS